MSVTGIVLCGGRSTRMGQDKAALRFGDESLLERVVRIVGEAVDEVIVVGQTGQGEDKPKGLSPRVQGLSPRLIRDPVDDLGPLAAIAEGLRASATDLNFVAACDMPLIRPAMIRRLLALLDGFDACVPVADGTLMTLCGVYRKTLAAEADALIASGQRSVKALVDRENTRRVDAAELRDIDPDLESFFSCDTPELYARALKIGADGGPGFSPGR